MKIFVQLSWRNIWRQKRRSMVVISTVAIGIFAMVTCVSFINGFNIQLIDNSINTTLGHIAIHAKGFQKDMKLDYHFAPDPALIDVVRNNSSVKAWTARVKIEGMVRSSEASRGIMVVGIDPAHEKLVSQIYRYTAHEDGSMFLDDPDEDAVLISRSMARKLDLVIGDKLVLMIQDHTGQIIGAGLKVKGLFVTPIEGVDKHMVFIGLGKLQQMTRLGKNISEINIITKDKNIADTVTRSLIRSIARHDLEILSWKDVAPNMVRMINLTDNVILFFLVIVFVAVIFTIINTMIMVIMERFHEIGVMKSIGTRPSRIFLMIIVEAFILSAIGLCIGLFLSIALVYVLSMSGVDLAAYSDNLRSWGTGSVIFPVISLKDVMTSACVVFATTLIAALYPAVKAARIKPLEALHYI